jgi:hypothetical protein
MNLLPFTHPSSLIITYIHIVMVISSFSLVYVNDRRAFFDKRMSHEVDGEALGDDFKGV